MCFLEQRKDGFLLEVDRIATLTPLTVALFHNDLQLNTFYLFMIFFVFPFIMPTVCLRLLCLLCVYVYYAYCVSTSL